MIDPASALAEQTIRALKAGQGISQVVAEVMRVFEATALTVDYAAISRRLDKLEAHAAEQLSDAAASIRDGLADKLRAGDIGETFGSIKSLKLPGLDSLAVAVRALLLSAYGTGDRDLRGEARGAIKQYSSVKAYADPLYTPREAIRWLEQKSFWVTGIYEDELINKAQQLLLQALKTGEPKDVTIAKLAELFGPFINETVDAEVVTPNRLQTIVRTNSTEAYNIGRITAARDPDIAEYSQGMLYSAVLDNRTTEVCQNLDGLVIPLDHPMLDRLAPPNHYNCFVSPRTPIFTSKGWYPIGKIRVGDLVLTHKGRFRPVLFAHHHQNPQTYRGDVIKIRTKYGQLVVTPGHPVLTQRGWIAAERVSSEDTVQYKVRALCLQCQSPLPDVSGAPGKYCGSRCQMNYEYATGSRSPVLITEAARAASTARAKREGHWFAKPETQELARRGRNASLKFAAHLQRNIARFRTPERRAISRVMGKRLVERWRANPELHPNCSSMANVSKPQRELFQRVGASFVGAELEFPVRCKGGVRFADVALPAEKIALQYDGAYWHRDAEKDARRANDFSDAGWQMVVYRDRVPSSEQLEADVGRILANHEGQYELMGVCVIGVERTALRRTVRLYNLEVAEDQSYIARGIAVHNCRSLLVNVPLGVGLDALGYEMITDADVERAVDWGKDHGMESFLANEQGCKCYQSNRSHDKESSDEPSKEQ